MQHPCRCTKAERGMETRDGRQGSSDFTVADHRKQHTDITDQPPGASHRQDTRSQEKSTRQQDIKRSVGHHARRRFQCQWNKNMGNGWNLFCYRNPHHRLPVNRIPLPTRIPHAMAPGRPRTSLVDGHQHGRLGHCALRKTTVSAVDAVVGASAGARHAGVVVDGSRLLGIQRRDEG